MTTHEQSRYEAAVFDLGELSLLIRATKSQVLSDRDRWDAMETVDRISASLLYLKRKAEVK